MWTQNTKREEGRERRAKRKLRTEELHCFHSSRLTNKGEWFFFWGGGSGHVAIVADITKT